MISRYEYETDEEYKEKNRPKWRERRKIWREKQKAIKAQKKPEPSKYDLFIQELETWDNE